MKIKIAILGEDIDEINDLQTYLLNLDEFESEVFYALEDFRESYSWGAGLNLLIIIVDGPCTDLSFCEEITEFYIENQNRFSCPILLITMDAEKNKQLRQEERSIDFVECSFNVDLCFLAKVMERIL